MFSLIAEMMSPIRHSLRPERIAAGLTPANAFVTVLRDRPSTSDAAEMLKRFSELARFDFDIPISSNVTTMTPCETQNYFFRRSQHFIVTTVTSEKH